MRNVIKATQTDAHLVPFLFIDRARGIELKKMDLEWEIRDSETFGKGVFSTRSIEKWSKLVQLKSEVNVMEDFAIKNHCSYCLKHCENSADLMSCPNCSIIKYCSIKCLENDTPYHRYECSWYHSALLSLTVGAEVICIPSRSQRFLMRFVSHLEVKYESMNSDLVDNCSNMSQELLDQWKSEAEEIRTMVPNFASRNSIEDLIKFYGILKSNSYMMRHKDSGECYGGQLIEVHSRINHSCNPNCVSSLDGTNVFLIALREIKPDEEITVSYTDSSKPRAVRQEYLKNNLFFDCKCVLCISDPDAAPEALRTSIICQCGNLLYGVQKCCQSCNEPVNYSKFEDIFVDFEGKSSLEKMKVFQETMKCLHECHWINNKIADLITKEFCIDLEYIRNVPGLLINLKTGLVKGMDTISNPFVLLTRYEYALALIHRHPELYRDGLLVASNYLKLAAHIKGVDDELAQKFAVVSKNWAETLNQLNS